MSGVKLRTVARTQGHTVAIKRGEVDARGVVFDFEEVPVLIDAFRRMVRSLDFDVCEMAFTTYLCAREHGVQFTALPIFLARSFHHGAIVQSSSARIDDPRDLEGRAVGVHRGYTVTTGVWARSILQEEYRVDLARVEWMCSGDEHVAEYRPPPNVRRIEPGQSLVELVVTGNLPAAVGLSIDDPAVEPLIPDAERAALGALATRGHYPINHLVVVRDDVLMANPGIATALFESFAKAKDAYVERLRRDAIPDPTDTDRTLARVMRVIGDPLPYGIEPNRAMIDELIRHAVTQRILAAPVRAEDVFAAETLSLVA